jgi:hypothetical protein
MGEITVSLPWPIWAAVAIWLAAWSFWIWVKGWLCGARKTWELINPDEPFPTAESIRIDIARSKLKSQKP